MLRILLIMHKVETDSKNLKIIGQSIIKVNHFAKKNVFNNYRKKTIKTGYTYVCQKECESKR